MIRAGDGDTAPEREYIEMFNKKGTPVIVAYNVFAGEEAGSAAAMGEAAVVFNAKTGEGIGELKKRITETAEDDSRQTMTGGMVKAGDVVMLVMPQDIQAPKGRLIMPQVQVMRELLDMGCKAVAVKTEDMAPMLDMLKAPPALVITDSQVFGYVDRHLDRSVPLTSFSILMAKYKGDIDEFAAGARAIAALKPGDRVLIAESCTHHALKGDIAREKLPAGLEEYVGGKLDFSNCSGDGLPEDIGGYDLIIHCGGCMVNRKTCCQR